MKKTILLIVIGLLTFQKINAQFSLGASAGVNFASAKFNDELPEIFMKKAVTYYFIGLIPKYRFKSKFSLSLNFQYSLKGYESDFENYDNNKFRYTYLDFLPIGEYQIFKFIELGLGANLGFKIEEEAKIGDVEWFSTKEIGLIPSTDFGLVVSVRGNFRNFFVIVIYNYGLTDISNSVFTDVNGNPIGEVNQYNRTLQVGAGYFFDFKKKD